MTDKITFTTNGEQHELPIDGSKTLRPGNVSPDMKLTVTGSFNPPPLITFNQNHQPIMTIHSDGRITLGENAQPTEAAAACIEAMSGMIQDMIKNAVSRQPTQSDALREENEQLRHDLERQITIANEHVNEVERLREHLISALDTLKDAEVCDRGCAPCNEARAALQEQSK